MLYLPLLAEQHTDLLYQWGVIVQATFWDPKKALEERDKVKLQNSGKADVAIALARAEEILQMQFVEGTIDGPPPR